MKWIGDRISFVDKKDSISFVIYPPKLGRKKVLIVVWFALWLLIGGYVFFQFFQDYTQEEKLALVIFMVFWFYFALRVFRTLLFLFFGKEYIKLDRNSLRIKKATGSYGKSKQYFIENITKFNQVELKDNSFQKVYDDSPWVRGANRIQFEYFGKTHSFGRKLEDKDVKLMFQVITKRIQKYLSKKG
ncbi:hypothetical protein CW751_09155 [Brumimicrobium salinarum]|uniref:Uncharacterized protein n=1 Tax=Brumimicrobium salinarum TaxID=2058658 RepID=A0A2I0R1T5_9FLAO|nr:hypothetical protein [Brumimicrobium salinarum]PKR80532.1 hypothetical protein CW751_09155 [Brumimicrobium salinarum]